MIPEKVLSNCLEDIDLESGFISSWTMIKPTARTLTLKHKQMMNPALQNTRPRGKNEL